MALTQYIILMAFHVGDVVAEVDTAEVMAIIVEGGLLEREEIGVAEVDMVGLPVVEEEVDLDSNRCVYISFGLSRLLTCRVTC